MQSLRLPYQASCQKLRDLGYFEAGDALPLPPRRPAYDDEAPLGVNFFRTFVGDGADLSNLTLPRTFAGRSELNDVSFAGSDLSESTLCWNDFVDVDFAGADLSRADLRASAFDRTVFRGAILGDADLRQSSFKECQFQDADMTGAHLTRPQQAGMNLSVAQVEQIDWCSDDGPEPGGG